MFEKRTENSGEIHINKYEIVMHLWKKGKEFPVTRIWEKPLITELSYEDIGQLLDKISKTIEENIG